MRTTSLVAISTFVMVVAAACTRHNPASCCSTQQQCDAFGLAEVTGCENGQVCTVAGSCIDPQCTTSAQCTGLDASVCVNQICVGACHVDDDCMGIPGKPYCETDGSCVGCLLDTQCGPDEPVCDATARACRGCSQDSECGNDVCLEADGTCAPTTSVIYLFQFGDDLADCSKATPCQSFAIGLSKVNASRKIIHIDGGTITVGMATVPIDRNVDVDGTATTISGGANAPVFSVGSTVNVRLSHLSISTGTGSSLLAATGSTLRLFDMTLTGSVTVSNSTLDVGKSRFNKNAAGDPAISCTSGTVAAHENHFLSSTLQSANCQATIDENVFDENSDGSVSATGGVVIVQNNLIECSNELADSMFVKSVAPGSTVRFNTFVNTSGMISDGTALNCDDTVRVTSNIFAWGSLHPHSSSTSPCTARYSLYDSAALASQAAGTGNLQRNSALFFKDFASSDFHLAPMSPARGAAEPGLSVTEDIEHTRRPLPTGSAPDVGAYESP